MPSGPFHGILPGIRFFGHAGKTFITLIVPRCSIRAKVDIYS